MTLLDTSRDRLAVATIKKAHEHGHRASHPVSLGAVRATSCLTPFRDVTARCNKQDPGHGSSALDTHTRFHIVPGVSTLSVAVRPSGNTREFPALDTAVRDQGAAAPRAGPFSNSHRLPNEHTRHGTGCSYDMANASPQSYCQHSSGVRVRSHVGRRSLRQSGKDTGYRQLRSSARRLPSSDAAHPATGTRVRATLIVVGTLG